MVCRLIAGGRWIRTTGTAAQKPWISAALLPVQKPRPPIFIPGGAADHDARPSERVPIGPACPDGVGLGPRQVRDEPAPHRVAGRPTR